MSPGSAQLVCDNVLNGASISMSFDNWPQIRRIVDKVHKHVCVHSTYSDMRTLLQRNKLWNDQAQNYLSQIVSECPDCKASSTPPPNRRVSLASLNREFNDVLCLDHMFLDKTTVLHMMDVSTRFSVGTVVDSTSMENVIYHLENLWFSQFWPPNSIHVDGAFQNEIMKLFLSRYDVEMRPVPPRRHSKNPIEPRYCIIRSIFLRLKHSEPNVSDYLHAVRAIRISNDLYRSDTLSAYEMAKGYTKPLSVGQKPIPVDDELRNAHDELIAKRKLTRILRSNVYSSKEFQVGDFVQSFIDDGTSKRGSWTFPRKVISIDNVAGIISVPGRNGKTVKAAIEDVRAAP